MLEQAFFWLTLILSLWTVSLRASLTLYSINGCPTDKEKSGSVLYSYKSSLLIGTNRDHVVNLTNFYQPPACETKCECEIETRDVQTDRVKPTPCIWAIVSCCSPLSEKIRLKCFELFDCVGSFWDKPCNEKTVLSAAKTIVRYYSMEYDQVQTGPAPSIK